MSEAHSPAPQSRRDFLRAGGALLAGIVAVPALGVAQPPKALPKAASSAKPSAKAIPRAITVYKDPNCGCCKLWIDHVRAAGFVPTVHDTGDMASVKASMGVPSALGSCHTARVGGYTIEGHVPADVIEKLLREAPVARGIAVPGMPAGSPGMEMGNRKDRYDIMIFDKAGKSRVYASK